MSEIYHLFDVDVATYDATAIGQAADTGCFDAFEGYMGISYAESWYGYSFLQPTSLSWDNGDREVVCFVYPFDDAISQSVGSAEGEARTL